MEHEFFAALGEDDAQALCVLAADLTRGSLPDVARCTARHFPADLALSFRRPDRMWAELLPGMLQTTGHATRPAADRARSCLSKRALRPRRRAPYVTLPRRPQRPNASAIAHRHTYEDSRRRCCRCVCIPTHMRVTRLRSIESSVERVFARDRSAGIAQTGGLGGQVAATNLPPNTPGPIAAAPWAAIIWPLRLNSSQ